MRASQEAAEIAILGPYHPYLRIMVQGKEVAIVAMSRSHRDGECEGVA